MTPRFDYPQLSRPAAVVVAENGVSVTGERPLPPLIEPTLPLVTDPIDESMVPVAHPRIRVLGNYWHAGWSHARPDCWLRADAMDRLGTVVDGLPDRWGLAVFDAWRPLALQAELYNAAYADSSLPAGFVAAPVEDPQAPPPHLTGGTVDLTLTLDGTPLALGTDFDGFTDKAAAMALEAVPGVDRELRRCLYWAMQAQGFVALTFEWWHFEYGTPRWAGVTGRPAFYGPATPPSPR